MEEWKFFKFTMVVVGNIIIAIFFIYLYFILQFMIAVKSNSKIYCDKRIIIRRINFTENIFNGSKSFLKIREEFLGRSSLKIHRRKNREACNLLAFLPLSLIH